ncbi:hypothetical protein ES703_37183 [subsurface metagenome]
MFYRVHADLAFRTEDEAKDFFHDCQLAILKAFTINPGTGNTEHGRISWELCLHEDDPNEPCRLVHHEETP